MTRDGSAAGRVSRQQTKRPEFVRIAAVLGFDGGSPISQIRAASVISGGRPKRGRSSIALSGPTALTRWAQRMTRWRSMPRVAASRWLRGGRPGAG
jgi:hypothetical protein